MFDQLAFGRGPHVRTVRLLHELFGLVEGRGACHLPDGVMRLGVSALRVFAEDLRRHERGPCPAAHGARVFPVPAGLTPAPEHGQATLRLDVSPARAVRP